MGFLHNPFRLNLVLTLFMHHSFIFKNFNWMRITEEGSIPEMRMWSTLLIKSFSKCCKHLSRSVFSFLNSRFDKGVPLKSSLLTAAAHHKYYCN